MLSVSIPAQIQRWSPDDEYSMRIPKPQFYDELKPYPFRTLYNYLIIPYAFVGAAGWILSFWGLYDFPVNMNTPLGVILHVIYFYILSCFVAVVYKNIKDNKTWHQRVQKIKSS
jgi:archaellum biogenesis protein FlaJ (TadC family)